MRNSYEMLIDGIEFSPSKNIIYISFPKGCTCGCYGGDQEPCEFCESLFTHFKGAGLSHAMAQAVYCTPREFYDWYFQWMMGAKDFPTDEEIIDSIFKNDSSIFEERKQQFVTEFKAAYYGYIESEIPDDLIPRWISDLLGIEEDIVKRLLKIIIII